LTITITDGDYYDQLRDNLKNINDYFDTSDKDSFVNKFNNYSYAYSVFSSDKTKLIYDDSEYKSISSGSSSSNSSQTKYYVSPDSVNAIKPNICITTNNPFFYYQYS